MNDQILFIIGPTASGKSEIGLELARRTCAEIISCDSMQIYKGMDIGTAKPSPEEQKEVPHHLIDIISPQESFSVYEYRELALKAIQKIRGKGKLPLFVGGSGLYIRAVVDGLDPLPGRVNEVREKLGKIEKEKGLIALYEKLQQVNPKRAKELHPNDKKRIIRALEIWELSEESGMYGKEKRKADFSGQFHMYGVMRDREELYQRVEQRVDEMMASGWLREVECLKKGGFSETAREAIGYKELLEHIAEKKTLEETVAEIKKRTRHLVKKQMTWFRSDKRIKWVPVKGVNFAEKTAVEILNDLKGI
ncbi:MAG: tRNA (adenosine(37)-N6)-dimethylallyltransferase MiaA [Omnitrophica bacterium RIFCSPLOWO2_12_FULL_44_17]|uniref:tRNA dimethylallyltransferase n=1 Tax=Candidatus Danuiimicrobium aquiferis TaxID=1801832 RepID=A0A1G1KVI3_9BACT|nr:MAG: tRNA (adenosine(37)-N6)-dimethylallyltransferase MiaA [Omnitrophica bacterium RIFCSPHIGHO2_02_FULL_45_28]OGW90437.1 MAG: tRNA (adenosine(37)-N6)-dimethylallyltransferase MiaA [Omnitrophica bacterium RIFCSPHIGHO2_12_FULL_44_12]OGW96946.1 MAG: tRNA (adenosine(37)-N6)-dimethylallyltransferase MiaA [Omnitrophica bacterium RIFCSPLOWO2_12_FULL_44_17]OGX03918.1 MAG: tRNA (adenosine(37)-N6)-dimethylallyltransferase MiaA [Omnitrophica bacterium RIFCSPLOWO2_02_FULL_44_11]